VSAPTLVCRRCQAKLVPRPDLLQCKGCRTAFDIVGNVPILLPTTLRGSKASQTRYFDARPALLSYEFAASSR
jgi:uncharacterized protein YbaR (Trm112 family)